MNTASELSYTVAVRTLCEFTARRGDLDLRFSPSPSAQEGVAGHQLVAARRPPGYRTEISLSGNHHGLVVRGRADGFASHLKQLEEIKTFRGDVHGITEAQRQLHWAQLKVYGHLMCAQEGLAELRLALVYFNLDEQQETVLLETHAAQALQAFFEQHCAAFMAWAQQEAGHRLARQAALAALGYPDAPKQALLDVGHALILLVRGHLALHIRRSASDDLIRSGREAQGCLHHRS